MSEYIEEIQGVAYQMDSTENCLPSVNDCNKAAAMLRAYAEAAKRVEMMEEALFQISVRLDAPREADMDEGDWHTDMISSAQYLANQAKRLAALEQAMGEKWHPGSILDTNMRADEIMREGK